ncbi:MAG: hypothetical protein M1822_009365 [Bathelium mastoideum]|nr:MAG: hypothetical protein M1822_009365 [Bathelium mastoideum]
MAPKTPWNFYYKTGGDWARFNINNQLDADMLLDLQQVAEGDEWRMQFFNQAMYQIAQAEEGARVRLQCPPIMAPNPHPGQRRSDNAPFRLRSPPGVEAVRQANGTWRRVAQRHARPEETETYNLWLRENGLPRYFLSPQHLAVLEDLGPGPGAVQRWINAHRHDNGTLNILPRSSSRRQEGRSQPEVPVSQRPALEGEREGQRRGGAPPHGQQPRPDPRGGAEGGPRLNIPPRDQSGREVRGSTLRLRMPPTHSGPHPPPGPRPGGYDPRGAEPSRQRIDQRGQPESSSAGGQQIIPSGHREVTFTNGTKAIIDVSNAELGKRDQSKFYLRAKDGQVRHFPHIEEMDWNDKKWVAQLNRWRQQSISRWHSPPTRRPPRNVYTREEMDFMREYVKNHVAAGTYSIAGLRDAINMTFGEMYEEKEKEPRTRSGIEYWIRRDPGCSDLLKLKRVERDPK